MIKKLKLLRTGTVLSKHNPYMTVYGAEMAKQVEQKINEIIEALNEKKN